MTKLILNAEQASVVSQSKEAVEIVDSRGNCLGVFVPAASTQENETNEIETALKRRDSQKPRYSTAEVLQHLQSITPVGDV